MVLESAIVAAPLMASISMLAMSLTIVTGEIQFSRRWRPITVMQFTLNAARTVYVSRFSLLQRGYVKLFTVHSESAL
jgi:hypothetical protein